MERFGQKANQTVKIWFLFDVLMQWSYLPLQAVRQTSAPPAAITAWRPRGTSLTLQLERKLLHAGVFIYCWDGSVWLIVCAFFQFRQRINATKGLNLNCYFLSRGTHIRSLPVFKPAGSPMANRDAELYAPYKTPPKAASSTNSSSSCNSSPTSRCETLKSWNINNCKTAAILSEPSSWLFVWPYVQAFHFSLRGSLTNPFFPD